MGDSLYVFKPSQMTGLLNVARETLPEQPVTDAGITDLLQRWLAQTIPTSPVDTRSLLYLLELDASELRMVHSYQHVLLRDILLRESCPPELILLFKEFLKRRKPLETDKATQAVVHCLYYLCIAHGLVYQGRCITSLSTEDVRAALLAILDELCPTGELEDFLHRALDQLRVLDALANVGR